jgi:hypothetical protein
MSVYWWWIGIGVGAVVLAGAVWWVWWRLPKRQMRSITLGDPKARADIEDNFRKTVGQALGGAAVLLAAGGAYVQFLQQQRASQVLMINNQIARGFEQLGSNNQEVRTGGIYALAGVMDSASSHYYFAIVSAICAFIRAAPGDSSGQSIDIETALMAINSRPRDMAAYEWIGLVNLSKAHLNHVDMSWYHLEKVNLSDADLSSASLDGIHLSGAFLSKANLSDAWLYEADLSGAILVGSNLHGAMLANANLTGTNLEGADLRDAILRQEQLDAACGINAKLPPGLTLKPCAAALLDRTLPNRPHRMQ